MVKTGGPRMHLQKAPLLSSQWGAPQFLQRRKLELADLDEEPFTNFGTNAEEKLFDEIEITELVELTKRLAE